MDDASDVEEALPAVLAECKKLILGMENKSVDQRKASLWVYGIGLVAGTVIAPALTAANAAKHAGAIAGLSALGAPLVWRERRWRTLGSGDPRQLLIVELSLT